MINNNYSLRGRRSKGKGKGTICLAPKSPFPIPFKMPATQAIIITINGAVKRLASHADR